MFCGVLRSGHFNTIRTAAKSVLQSEDLAVGRLLNPSAAFLVSLQGDRQLSTCNHLLRKQPTPITCCCLKRQRSVPIRPMMSSAKKTNRLALEKSPYLLQHATNPVDWYPWGQEAFEEAKKQDKLIFLSVGYSTCHWCHVMEHESFENEDIAKIMNEHFINVKVDREERPDVDKVYMTFVQGIAGAGGWPMSTWLTPDLKPVHGGTYYPPDDRYFNQPGFKSLLLLISSQWKEDRQKFYDSGTKIMEVLERHSKLEPSDLDGALHITNDSWKTCLTQLSARFEPKFGGFSESPKFPQPSNFNFLFHIYSRNPQSEEGQSALHMCLHSLTMKAKGGIHDHISQGFARYSTDEKWHVPHFEKMLYDQGQLLVSYSQAYVATKDEFYKEIIHDIFTYVGRDLSHKSGGFFSAEDADSLPGFDSLKKKEGAFCVWTHEEVDSLLGSKLIKDGSPMTLADLACYHFDIKPNGNVNPYQDPHDELKNQNVLIVTGSEVETAEKFGISLEETKLALKQIQQILHQVRQNRPRPHLDDKMVAAWNGLMISGLSKAYEAICDEVILERAEKAASFLKEHMYNEQTGTLLRCCYQEDGSVSHINEPISGFADDYAFVIRGLLDLYEASGNVAWLEWANQLQDKQDDLFWDPKDSGYFSMAQDQNILLRLKEGQDGAEPTCNSVSASNLVRLAGMLDRHELQEKARKLLLVFKQRLEKIPAALPEMSSSLLLFQDSCTQVVVTGDPRSEAAQILLAEIRSCLIPGRMLGYADGNSNSILYKRNESMKKMRVPKDGSSSVYLCRNQTCSLPVMKPEQLRSLLEERIAGN